MKARQFFQAARRLPLAVLLYQLRRKGRDLFVSRFPAAYARRLERWTRSFPALDEGTLLPEDLAAFVGRYYRKDNLACEAAGRGVFDLMGRRVDFGSIAAIDWRHRLEEERDHHLWRMKLCQLEVLHSLLAEGRAGDEQTAEALLDSFEQAAGFALESPFKTTWAPYGASHRILALLSGLALAERRGGVCDRLEQRIRMFVRRDAAFVRANVEHDLRNNHTERNLAALCFYGMACTGYDAAQAACLDREVRAIIEQTILPDGMQVERSAMYQGLSVMSLRIFAAAPFLEGATRRLARERLRAAEQAWLLMSHRDGEIVLFNDSWMGEVPVAKAILTDEARTDCLPDAGYARLSSGLVDLWMDAGAIGPHWNPGHGHADFLAVEVDFAGKRLLVDPGTSQYFSGPRRAHERSAASHNGPCFVGVEPVDYIGCFKVGRLAAASSLLLGKGAGLPPETIGGSLKTSAGTVRRVAAPLYGDGMMIADAWSSRAFAGRSRFLVPGEWRLAQESPSVVHLRKGACDVWLEVIEGCVQHAGQDLWCRRYMAPEAAHVLDVVPRMTSNGQFAAFRISRMPPGSGEGIENLQALCALARERL